MYALKAKATRENRVPSHVAPDFRARSWITSTKYGRSFEVGLVAKHYLRHYMTRLPGMTTSGIGMVTKGRMGFRPHRIVGLEGLDAILARATELEEARQRSLYDAPVQDGSH